MNKGTVKFFNVKKGFGFIITEDNKELFVHQSDIVMKGFRRLNDGETVTYELAQDNQNRPYAANVKKG
jgi:CspA family cold shock protein